MRKLLLVSVVLLFLNVFVCGCEKKPEYFHIGVLQWTEKVEPFNKTFRGVMDGLNDKGYRQDVNLGMIFRNAEQDSDAALKFAMEFVAKDVDLIVALGTGSSLAALEATKIKQTPIVFSIVGAPMATGIIDSYEDSGRNISGVSMKVPVADQFRAVAECLPDIKTIGILYCTKMPQAMATGREGLTVASQYGWQPLDLPIKFDHLPQLAQRLRAVSDRVDAVYIPTDPILSAPDNLKTILEVLNAAAAPVISVAERFVEQGSLMALNCGFYEIGRQAAGQVAAVIAGVSIRQIPTQKPTITKLSLNLKQAKMLGLEIKRNCILRADRIIE